MLPTSEQLKSANEPDWRIYQATQREAAAHNKAIEDLKSQARWNRKLVDKGYEVEIVASGVQAAKVANVNHEKSQEEIVALKKTLAIALATDEAVETKYTFIPATSIKSPIDRWAAALPAALIKQTYKKHHNSSSKLLSDAYSQLISLGFNELDIDLARLTDGGLLSLAGAQAASSRAADGYTWTEPCGRPEHDAKFNMKRLRARRAEVIANLEISLKLIGIDRGRSLYSGDESKRLRDEANTRTAEYLATAMVVIPTVDSTGSIVGEKIIPLSKCGNTRYKSLSEFIGFVVALSARAAEEGRKAVMITTNAPARWHPSSPFYDGTTTPQQVSKWLSKQSKAARDTLRKWGVDAAGCGTKEPHGSAIPHNHIAMFHRALEVAEIRYNSLIEFMRTPLNSDDDLISREAAEQLILAEYLQAKPRDEPDTPDVWMPAMAREEFIDGMARDLIECAFERHFIDLERDDHTGRLIYGVGVNFKHNAEKEHNGASIVSYVLTYILKSFFISVDKLPKREDFNSDKEYEDARSNAIKQQVEAGGELSISAWAAAHGIRTREMFGMPSRSPFKTLGKQHKNIGDAKMESMRQTVLNNGHYEYLMAQGGLNASRKIAEFRMHSEVLNSNYALRPDMIRRRVLGVVRYEFDEILVETTHDDDIDLKTNQREDAYDDYSYDIVVMQWPAFFHKTRIEGCFIRSGMLISVQYFPD